MTATATPESLVLDILREGGPMDTEEIEYQLERRGAAGDIGEALAGLERDGRLEQMGDAWNVVDIDAEDDAEQQPERQPDPEEAEPEAEQRVCKLEGCGVSFTPEHGNQVYHSEECRELAAERKRRSGRPSEVTRAIERAQQGKPTSMRRVFDEIEATPPPGEPKVEAEGEEEKAELPDNWWKGASGDMLLKAVQALREVAPEEVRTGLVEIVGMASTLIKMIDDGADPAVAVPTKRERKKTSGAPEPKEEMVGDKAVYLALLLELLRRRLRNDEAVEDDLLDRIERLLGL